MHPAVAFTFSAENYGNLPTVKSTHNFCIPCGSRFSHITMYQLHIAGQVHKGIEPEDNFDDEKMEALKESNRQRMEDILVKMKQAKQDKMAQMQKNIKNIKDFQLQKGHLQQLQQKSTLQRKICLKCRKVFADHGYLKQHMHQAHGEKDFEPSEGNSYTIQTTQQNSRGVLLSNPRTNPQNLENRLMNKKNYVCIEGDCKKEFVEKKGLKIHMRAIHKMDTYALKPENRLIGKPVVTSPSMASQEARPHLPKNCVPCGRSFPHHVLFQIHMRDFHANKSFSSPNKSVNSSPRLLAPKPPPTSYPTESEMANGEKLECLICHKKFAGKPNLKRHIKQYHMNVGKTETEKENKDETEKENKDEVETIDEDPLADPLALDTGNDEEDLKEKKEEDEGEKEDCKEKKEDEDEKVDLKEKKEDEDEKVVLKEKKEDEDEKEDLKEKKEENELKEKDEDEKKEKKEDEDEDKKEEDEDEKEKKEEDKDKKEEDEDKKEYLKKKKREDDDDDIEIIEDDDEIEIIDDSVAAVKNNISPKDQKLIEQMFMMMRKYGCCHCPQRYDSQAALRHHLKIHPKKPVQKKSWPKPFDGSPTLASVTITKVSSPKKVSYPRNVDEDGNIIKSPFPLMNSIRDHDNEDGPVCFKCQKICKDSANLKNHILSH